jgi:hypothetical protein
MNVKLLIGIVLFVIGLATAVIGIAGVGTPVAQEESSIVVQDNQGHNVPGTVGRMAIPLVAALSLAVGGLLIGVSLGNWKNPRTTPEAGDEVVNPEGYHKMKHV